MNTMDISLPYDIKVKTRTDSMKPTADLQGKANEFNINQLRAEESRPLCLQSAQYLFSGRLTYSLRVRAFRSVVALS